MYQMNQLKNKFNQSRFLSFSLNINKVNTKKIENIYIYIFEIFIRIKSNAAF